MPLSEAGRREHGRQQITRGGFASQTDAAVELRQAIQLLEFPDTDDDAGRLEIAALIRDHYRRYQQLPDATDVRRRLGAGLSLTVPETTGMWLDEWLAGKRKLAANTRRSYGGFIARFLKPLLGDVPLSKLTTNRIRAAYDEIVTSTAGTRRPVGPATLQRIHATLRAALNDAVRQRRLLDNPALLVEVETEPRPKAVIWTRPRVIDWMATGRRPKVGVWTPEQAGAFLAIMAKDRLYAYYHLLVFRGPRRGEGVGLRWPEVDLEAGTFTVTQQIVQVGWETVMARPKADSDGVVALDSMTTTVLRAHQEQQRDERLRMGSAWTDTQYVFTTETGQPVHPDYVSRHFMRVIKQANTLRTDDTGQAVKDVQATLGLGVDGQFGLITRRAVAGFQSLRGLTPNGIVDPHAWYLLFPEQPLRPYPPPGYLPPVRLHDLRHLAATLALAGGAEMKVVSAMLRHSSTQITADTYTSVLPEIAIQAAEAAAQLVQQPPPRANDGAVSPSLASSPENDEGRPSEGRTPRSQVVRREGLEPPTR